ncbi:VOC family protein [Flavobacterium sp. ST-75]|uniref:VOC family protein n=1 Tax=Flavobacterium rhizophilum TaxID=3163296 RepID=A0ABW8YIP9_9FLAO
MGKVTGIGGLFFRSKDHVALGKWYEKYFGIKTVGSGEVWKTEAGTTVFAPFKADTKYFSEPQQFMVNFRVDGLDEFLETLKADGIKIDEHREEMSMGKFAWVYDPDGNKIELWEPTPENEWRDDA